MHNDTGQFSVIGRLDRKILGLNRFIDLFNVLSRRRVRGEGNVRGQRPSSGKFAHDTSLYFMLSHFV
jgi:hypothetical protein